MGNTRTSDFYSLPVPMGNANVSVSYDQITPSKAESFLSKNHELQRDISPNKVGC